MVIGERLGAENLDGRPMPVGMARNVMVPFSSVWVTGNRGAQRASAVTRLTGPASGVCSRERQPVSASQVRASSTL